jgi:hypothetical protein
LLKSDTNCMKEDTKRDGDLDKESGETWGKKLFF